MHVTHRPRVAIFLVLVAALAIAAATLTPVEHSSAVLDRYCVVCGRFAGVDIVLNILLFMPLGAALAFARVRPAPAIALMCAFTVIIELLQVGVVPGRDASIGDVVMNSIGGVAGFVLGARRLDVLDPAIGAARWLTAGACAAWLVIQAIAAYALTPVFPASPYYGQIAPEIDGMPRLSGRIVTAQVGDVAIGEGRLTNATTLRELLARGAAVRVSAIFTEPQSAAAIVRIVDERQNGIATLDERDGAVTFGVRTGADVLRFHPVRFGLRGAFVSGVVLNGSRPTLITGRYGQSTGALEIRGASGAVALRVSQTVSSAWRLLVPFQTYRKGDARDRLLDAVWLFVLALPIGFYARRAAGTRPSARVTVAIFVVLTAVTGLFIVPALLDVHASGASDVLASLVGFALGFLLPKPGPTLRDLLS